MSLNCLIVDDEEYSRSSLFYLLKQHCPEIKVNGYAKSVAEAKNLLDVYKIDVVFLDIAMPRENGFALIPKVAEVNASVIFTTAYDQYAIKAFKINAIDYLLKPIDIGELKEAVKKCILLRNLIDNASTNNAYSDTLNNLYDHLADGYKQTSKTITINGSFGFKVISLDEIIYIEAADNYAIFYLVNNESIISKKPLGEYEEMLQSSHFFRIHKSSIINLKFLKDYSSVNGGFITLTNGISIPVSRRRIADFLQEVKNFYN